MSNQEFDVVVIGAGNAALCAALAAQENGAKVLVLERAPEHKRGGNSHFTGGLIRFPYNGIDDVRQLIPDMSDAEAGNIDVGSYSEEQFYETIARVTEYMADPELTTMVVSEALNTMKWMRSKGIRFALSTGRQAFKTPEGKYKFWGSAPIEFVGGGIGLVEMLFESAEKYGLEIWYNARGYKLITDANNKVCGVKVKREGKEIEVRAKAVVVAAGGFEANPQWRAQYLGPNWDLAKVRGTEYNTGDGLKMALEVGAQAYGHWSGCHAVQWDLNAPTMGDRKVGELYQKHSYPLGIVVNRDGKRFIDEGADFRNFTYAKYGKEVMKQPEMRAVQIFDAKTIDKTREEYRIKEVTKGTANSLEELAELLELNPQALAETVKEYNAAINDAHYDPTVKDGKSTVGLEVNKTNWALPIDTPPYYGFAVTCGITFTFGGVRINNEGQVLNEENEPIAGLYAAGEMVGGLFYHNYPGGTGLSTGAVFGKVAGTSAAAAAK
jgi:tricarballylate dehydrogenase